MSNFHATFKVFKFTALIYIYLDIKIIVSEKEQFKCILNSHVLPPLKYGVTLEGAAHFFLGPAHTLVPCAPFMPRRASAGALSNVAGAYHWFLALLETYCMLHQILRSTKQEKAYGTSV